MKVAGRIRHQAGVLGAEEVDDIIQIRLPSPRPRHLRPRDTARPIHVVDNIWKKRDGGIEGWRDGEVDRGDKVTKMVINGRQSFDQFHSLLAHQLIIKHMLHTYNAKQKKDTPV